MVNTNFKELNHDFSVLYNMFFDYTEQTTISHNCEENGDLLICVIQIQDKSYKYSENLSPNTKNQIRQFNQNCLFKSLCDYTGKSMPWGNQTGVHPVTLAHQLIDSFGEKSAYEKLLSDYFIEQNKANLIIDIAKTQKPLLPNNNSLVDVYIGIPFCVSRCSYCSFSVIGIEKKGKLQEDYTMCLCNEIEKVGKAILDLGYVVENIYIGGGTPTALEENYFCKVLKTVSQVFSDVKEFTCEAGRPDTITLEKLQIMKENGVTRISVNPQTMHQKTLDSIGRKHTVTQTLAAYNLARKLGFLNINMDLIAGLPDETLIDFKYSFDSIMALNPDSITVHSLALKRSSKLTQSNYTLNRTNVINQMLDYAYKQIAISSLHPYYLYRQKNIAGNLENIGFCKNNCECLYNINIMNENNHVLALGCGGVSKRVFHEEKNIKRRSDPKDVEVYIDRIDSTISSNIDFFALTK